MTTRRETVVWDSCIFIEAIDEGGKPHRREEIGRLLAWARGGSLAVAASYMTWTEVLNLGGEDAALTRKKIRDFLENDYFHFRPVDEVVASLARDIRRDSRRRRSVGKPVTPTDSVHLATALLTPDCNVFLTYDGENPERTSGVLLPFDGMFAFERKKLRILTPRQWIDSFMEPLLKGVGGAPD